MPDNARVSCERERMPHLAPQGLDVPAQRPCLCQRGIREAMDLVNADQPALEARQNRAAAFGSEIERKVRSSESLRPYDIAPYAQQGFGQRNVYSRSKYRLLGAARGGLRPSRPATRAPGRGRRAARRARHGVQRGRADVGPRIGRHAVRALSRFPASRAMSSRSSTIARWCSGSRAPRRASRFIFPGTRPGTPASCARSRRRAGCSSTR